MITIRDMAANEAHACAAIFEAAWNEAFPHAPRTVDAAAFAAETADEIVLVAIAKQRVRGFASLYARDAFLHHLYVDPGVHRRGIGSALLREVASRANGPLNLKCQLTNTRARVFYAKHGFAEVEHGSDQHGRWVRLLAADGV